MNQLTWYNNGHESLENHVASVASLTSLTAAMGPRRSSRALFHVWQMASFVSCAPRARLEGPKDPQVGPHGLVGPKVEGSTRLSQVRERFQGCQTPGMVQSSRRKMGRVLVPSKLCGWRSLSLVPCIQDVASTNCGSTKRNSPLVQPFLEQFPLLELPTWDRSDRSYAQKHLVKFSYLELYNELLGPQGQGSLVKLMPRGWANAGVMVHRGQWWSAVDLFVEAKWCLSLPQSGFLLLKHHD